MSFRTTSFTAANAAWRTRSVCHSVTISRRWYQIKINELARGQAISHKNKIWIVGDCSMHSQGRMGSHYKVELKDAHKGFKVSERFNAGSFVEGVDLTDRMFQFLYADDRLHMMDRETLEEADFAMEEIEGAHKVLPYLNEELDIKVQFLEDKPLRVVLPTFGEYKVVYSDPAPSSVVNDGRGTSQKHVILENQETLQVPDFIQVNDYVIVDLQQCKYHGRSKRKA